MNIKVAAFTVSEKSINTISSGKPAAAPDCWFSFLERKIHDIARSGSSQYSRLEPLSSVTPVLRERKKHDRRYSPDNQPPCFLCIDRTHVMKS